MDAEFIYELVALVSLAYSGPLILEDTEYRCPTDPELSCDLLRLNPLPPQLNYFGRLPLCRRDPSLVLALGLRFCNSLPLSFQHYVALELGKATHQLEHKLPRGSGRIELHRENIESNTLSLQP